MAVLQRHFRDKRDYVLERFKRMGFDVKVRWGGGGKVENWGCIGMRWDADVCVRT